MDKPICYASLVGAGDFPYNPPVMLRHRPSSLALFALLLFTCGCHRVPEKRSIVRYADAVRQTNKLAAELSVQHRALRKLLGTESPAARRFVDQTLLPLWKRYLPALRSVPCETEALKSAHLKIVAAHEKRFQALERLRNGLGGSNLALRVAAYLRETDESRRLERAYRDEMKRYFERVGVLLLDR
ncbi:MAG: hypothetical protein KC609_16920 [Myxococcales bacterium]|nr:hypothetical protein [Myxococcales bacterium]